MSLAPSAYLASAASTEELTTSLILSRLRDVFDSGIATAMSAWSQSSTSPSTTSIAPSPPAPASAVQRVWDNQCCEVQANQLLDAAIVHVERAGYIASRAPGSSDWLHTLPLSSIELKMDNATVRIAVGLRLGSPLMRPHICVCRTEVTVNGCHGLSCRHGSGRHSRHSQVNDILCRAFNAAGAYATREPHSLCGRNDKRPVGTTQIPWRRGRCLAWDATCPNTYAQSYVLANRRKAGSAATEAELKKLHKYQDISTSVDCIPVAIESSGVWGQHAMELVSEIGRRLSEVSHEHRQHRSCVSGLQWLFNAAMPPVLLGLCRSIIT